MSEFKERTVSAMVNILADKNNTIDLDVYAKGCNDMFDQLEPNRNELLEALKYLLDKACKPVNRNDINAQYYDRYFEIEQLITKSTTI